MNASQHTTSCPHCGCELEPIVIPLGAPIVVGHKPCTCFEAQQEAARLQAEQDADQNEQKLLDLKRAYDRAGIKPRFQSVPDAHCELVDTLTSKALQGQGAYLFGSVGTGKTSVACGVAMAFIAHGKTARVVDALDIVGTFYATYSGAGTEKEVLERLCGVDLLVIDDLGKETPKERPLSHLFRVIDERYAQMRPIIVTSQFRRKEIAERIFNSGSKELAEAVASRLAAMTKSVEFSGRDWRLA